MNIEYQLLMIENNKQLKKFYSIWSVTASKLIKKYAQDNSIQWYNTKWRQKSKDIPFYIRTKAPKSFKGNIWFASRPVNYAFKNGVGKFKPRKKLPRKAKNIKPVFAYGRWFKPKSYSPDITINNNLTNVPSGARVFASKSTSKTKFKRPLLWYVKDNKVKPVTLNEQMSDILIRDDAIYGLINEAFNTTVKEGKYV